MLKNKKSIILGILVIVLVLAVSVLLAKIDILNTEIEALNSDLETQAEYIIQREIVIGDKDVEIAKIQQNNRELEQQLSDLSEELIEKDETINELMEYANVQAIQENHEIIESSWHCKNGKEMLYALYVPNGLKTNEALPLILYLHGSGESGSNLRQLENCPNGFSTFVYDGRIAPNAYILMPQTPDGSWDRHLEDLMDIILYVCDNYKVDKSRISITGHSLGGYGTMSMVYKYPDFFSAAAPFSSRADAQKCIDLVKIPIWFHVGETDNPNSYIEANEAINKNGGNSRITVYQNEGHRIPPHYLDNNCEIVNWLISQQKG